MCFMYIVFLDVFGTINTKNKKSTCRAHYVLLEHVPSNMSTHTHTHTQVVIQTLQKTVQFV